MPLRSLLRYLASNERVVQRLADSYPMRKLARMCVAFGYRARELAENRLHSHAGLRSLLDRILKKLADDTKALKKK